MTTPMLPGIDMVRTAEISDDGRYRYRLGRTWTPDLPRMAFLMLNPSTADAEVDDPTIRRCMGFARREGCGGIEVVNLYGLRATKPVHLLDHPDPEGPENVAAWDAVLLGHVGPVVGAWGAWPFVAGGRGRAGLPESEALESWCSRCDLLCLGHTGNRQPRHPLYLPSETPLEEW